MTAAEICIVVFVGIGTILIAIPAVYRGVDYFQERSKRKRPLFTRILYEMEKMHKRKHEVNFILLSDDVRYVDFDRVLFGWRNIFCSKQKQRQVGQVSRYGVSKLCI